MGKNDILSSFFTVGVEENQQNKGNLLGAFGEDKPDPPPSLEFRLGSSLSEHDHWTDTCSQWEALNFGDKAAAWDMSQRGESLITKARAEENGVVWMRTERGGDM